MFDNFERAQRGGKARWIYGVLAGVVAVHGILLLGLLAKSWWKVDKLSLPHEGVALAVAPPPPSPPPARKGSPKPSEAATSDAKVKRAVEEATQPVRLSAPEETGGGTGPAGDPNGTRDIGPAIGGGGDCVGICPELETAPPETDPCKKDPEAEGCKKDNPVVPQHAIEQRRIAGESQIHPDRETKLAMKRAAQNRAVITIKMCLSASGTVRSTKLLKSSGYPAYDQRVLREMRGWRYTPFEVNGVPTPVCTGVTLLYNQDND